MNVAEPLRGILVSEGHPELNALPLGRGTWDVLFERGERPLLLPAGGYPLQARCLSYFVQGGAGSACARALLRANAAEIVVDCVSRA